MYHFRGQATLLLVSLIIAAVTTVATAQTYVTKEVSFQNGDLTLTGTLTLPEDESPHAALVLLSGSGPQDRDNAHPSLPGYRPFATIADHLAERGVAVLRYDERGVGASGGDHASATSLDLADDAEGALEYLRTRADIQPDQIGLLGHSEGAWLAAMVAARNPNVAFVIALAGHAVPGYELLPVQAERGLRASGTPDAQIEAVLTDQKQEIDLIVARDWEALERRIHDQAMDIFQAMPEAQLAQLGDLEAAARRQVEESMVAIQGWLYTFLTSDPAESWEQVRVPVLAVFAALDTQVDLEQNRPALEQALRRAGNEDVTVRVLPNANHLFLTAATAGDDDASLSPELVPALLELIEQWLGAHID